MSTLINDKPVKLFFPYPSTESVEVYFENGDSYLVNSEFIRKIGIDLSIIPFKK